MNRPIKFRVWNPQEKKVKDIELKYLRFSKRGEVSRYSFTDGEIDHGEYINIDDVVLMQFTGLLDKNGREIYEGDVVRAVPDGYEPRVFLKVEWAENGWWLRNSDIDQRLTMNDALSFTRVGNIYENPELIK